LAEAGGENNDEAPLNLANNVLLIIHEKFSQNLSAMVVPPHLKSA
jgi:hypothetical protein